MYNRPNTLRAAAAAFSTLLPATAGLGPATMEDEAENAAPLDFGRGHNRPPLWRARAPAGIEAGPPNANVTGVFSAPVPWPIEPIHMVFLPDGRVLNYGTDTTGVQGASLVYDVWSPAMGTGSDAHMVLPNTTATNIFCAGQTFLPASGTVLVVGGSLLPAGENALQGISSTTVFAPATNGIAPAAPMLNPRWYPTMVPLPNGQVFVLGGRQIRYVPTTQPELLDPVNGWTALTGADSGTALTVAGNWFYPRAFLEPGGNIIDLAYGGSLFEFNTTGEGSITELGQTLPRGGDSLPVAMFAPGLILTARQNAAMQIVDLTGPTPVVTDTASVDQVRAWSNMTVLADGTVLMDGGSAVANQLIGVDTTAQIWNPATGAWTAGATAAIPRLYHSTSLLLPDGSVVTAGGGDPGPVRNMNAEIYYPPYLFNADGTPALRPFIDQVQATAEIGQTLTLQVDASDTIGEVTLIRAGAVTHSANLEQRFFNLPFTQSGPLVTATLPANPNVLVPGTYMVFAFQNGVPSVAGLVSIME